VEENSCLEHASTLQRNGFRCESMNLLRWKEWSVTETIKGAMCEHRQDLLLIIAFQLRSLVLTARFSLVWAMVKSIGLGSFIVQRVGPVTAFLYFRG
jgi:hypothetical protein